MIDKLALIWYSEESKSEESKGKGSLGSLCPKELQLKPPTWFELTERRRDAIRDRVKLVLDGEVRKSEMSSGDLAIYRGRIRCIEDCPLVRQKENGAGFRIIERRRFNYWDCVNLTADYTSSSIRLFGYSNIGRFVDTNMQVAGHLCSSAVFSWTYIEMPWEGLPSKEVEYFLENSIMTLCTGDHPVFSRRLIDLIEPQATGGVFLPIGQTFDVRLEFYYNSFMRIKEVLKNMDPERNSRLYVHLEGMEARDIQ